MENTLFHTTFINLANLLMQRSQRLKYAFFRNLQNLLFEGQKPLNAFICIKGLDIGNSVPLKEGGAAN